MPRAPATKTDTVMISAMAGRLSTLSPKRRHAPTRSSGLWFGSYSTTPRRGQNPRLPKMVRSAGSSVSPATIAQNTPSAAVGPSELVLPASASRSTSIARVTVRPLARIAGPARVSACAIASCLSRVTRSSSRYLETSNRQ